MMTLAAGTKLGPYEIVAPLGAGGMGEVYRARDTRLGRDVAVKILPASFAADADKLRRFEQEARAAGALNHPNILAIYDIGVESGAPYLVTELLEGETLRERMRAVPLTVRKALDVAVQTVRGVAAAHDRGIVHRDLKPANIFLTNDGHVKILDFGLAKLIQRETAGSIGDTQSPTRSADPVTQTEAGVVLGTVGYMSPEQVRGQPADARSDIFALGTILYEMLSGKRAFEKDSSADTMAAILKEDPPELAGDGKKVLPVVERVVRHCLEKNPAERFQSARDLAFDLESLWGASTSSAAALAGTGSTPQHNKRRRTFAMLGTAGLIAVGVAAYLFGRGAVMAPPTYHQLTFDRGLIYAARFGSYSQTIYYSAAWNGEPVQIYSTNPDSPESRNLNLSNSSLFAASSAGIAISVGCKDLFIGDCEGTLATIPISGGTPREIADNVVSADWAPDGSDMAAIREVDGQFQVEFPLNKILYISPTWLNFVRVSPRGNAVAFTEYSTTVTDFGAVVILDRQGTQKARSSKEFPSVEGLAWAPSGNEVWFGATDEHAWANAIHALGVSGKERLVLRLPGMLRLHDVSRNGQVLLSKEVWRTDIQLRGSGDSAERRLPWLDSAVLSDLSPDGKEMAFGEYGEASVAPAGYSNQSYLRKTDGAAAVKLGNGYGPMFSPDTRSVVVFMSDPPHLAILPTGVGETKNLDSSGIRQFYSQGWMPDGKEIYFAGNDGHEWRMYVQDLAGGKPRAFTRSISIKEQNYEANLVSPDGKQAFARSLSGTGLLYPVDGGEAHAVPGLLSEDCWANWSSDGRAAYVYQDKKIQALVFRLDLSTGERQLVATLAPGDPAGLTAVVPVRITADGKTYGYSYNRSSSQLFLVDGVK
jgi:serine/threonine protein kinase